MIERFNGDHGKRKLIDSLLSQKAVHRTPEMAEDLATVVTLNEFKNGDFIVKQDDEDTDMFFILTGKVDIIVNDRVVALRVAGEHVGGAELEGQDDLRLELALASVAGELPIVTGITSCVRIQWIFG